MRKDSTRRQGAADAADRAGSRGRPVTGAELVARALRKQAEREGVRIMVRMPADMLARATACAREIDEPLADWCNKVCRQYRSGVFDGVAVPDKLCLATRAESAPTHIRAPRGMSAADIKQALARGILYCEARRIVYRIEKPARFLFDEE